MKGSWKEVALITLRKGRCLGDFYEWIGGTSEITLVYSEE